MRPDKAIAWRAILIQGLLLAGIAGAASATIRTALANMRERGLASGFGFLTRSAGFDVAQSLIAYGPTDSYARLFLVGALNTLLVAVIGIVGATLLGLLAGVTRRARSPGLRAVALGYVELARNMPLPIQLLIWYGLLSAAPPPRAAIAFGQAIFVTNRGLYLPLITWNAPAPVILAELAGVIVLGGLAALLVARLRAMGRRPPSARWVMAATLLVIVAVLARATPGLSLPHPRGYGFAGGLEVSPPLLALSVALIVYAGAYIAELVRGGLDAVPQGQAEAAKALGLSAHQTLRRVTLPQAMRVIVPPLISQYLNLAKNASLAVIVGYPDLVALFGGTALNQTGQAIETLSLVLLFYLVLNLILSGLVNAWNRRTSVWATGR